PLFENSAGPISPPRMGSLVEFEKRLGIPLELRPPQDNLCMANNQEVRLEFRTTFHPIHVLDYIYAVLHSNGHFGTLALGMAQGFPRLPYPVDLDRFWKLVEIGGEIRQFHLENPMSFEEKRASQPLIALADKVDAIGIL